MSKIQKKSLQHILQTLDSIDNYQVYKALTNAMDENGIDSAIRTKIMDLFQDKISEQNYKIATAKEWIDVLIDDIE